MVPNARWATDEPCGADLPCRQAVRSDTLTMCLHVGITEDGVEC